MEDFKLLKPESAQEPCDDQLDAWRDELSCEVGDCLFVAGVCTMIMAVVVTGINCLLRVWGIGLGQIWWLVNPLIIALLAYLRNRKPAGSPTNILRDIVLKVWLSCAIFAVGFCLSAMFFNYVESQIEGLEVFARVAVKPYRVVLLVMGMALAITGFVIKQCWVWISGIVLGLGGFIWISLQYSTYILSEYRALEDSFFLLEIFICIVVEIFAFSCFVLPGHFLKYK